jgi:hypothetical protein
MRLRLEVGGRQWGGETIKNRLEAPEKTFGDGRLGM